MLVGPLLVPSIETTKNDLAMHISTPGGVNSITVIDTKSEIGLPISICSWFCFIHTVLMPLEKAWINFPPAMD